MTSPENSSPNTPTESLSLRDSFSLAYHGLASSLRSYRAERLLNRSYKLNEKNEYQQFLIDHTAPTILETRELDPEALVEEKGALEGRAKSEAKVQELLYGNSSTPDNQHSDNTPEQEPIPVGFFQRRAAKKRVEESRRAIEELDELKKRIQIHGIRSGKPSKSDQVRQRLERRLIKRYYRKGMIGVVGLTEALSESQIVRDTKPTPARKYQKAFDKNISKLQTRSRRHKLTQLRSKRATLAERRSRKNQTKSEYHRSKVSEIRPN